ncbi:hypothetical protein Lesp02_77240 [Lentzea sp. NBRC 105346]|uniref:hypothetical protein n=1 Tax=Lentzea sp. NBRC 105346 TaxID=3032205 RepID=UPI0024A319A1|nr:hypothetical protein [Lentzea sp. NBRC 105346]GLZ35537.1 hypothetical protein Lesp02_77240 [Lentzea sp. NBRC 105346]
MTEHTPAPGATPTQGTTIAAAILALIAGLNAGSQALTWIYIFNGGPMPTAAAPGTETVERGPAWTLIAAGFAVEAVSALLLILGAILLFARRTAGRYVTLAGMLLVVGAAVARMFMMAMSGMPGTGSGLIAFDFVGLGLPIAAGVLAMLPSTGRWIAAK